MSRSDSDFERSNISLKKNKPDGVDLNSDGLDCCVRKNEGKIVWFSGNCLALSSCSFVQRHCILSFSGSSALSSWEIFANVPRS